jgi:predicted dehydrogenase
LQKGEKTTSPTGASGPLAGFSPEPHRDQFTAIAEAILQGDDPPLSGEESIRSLAVVQAVYASDRTGLPVQMKDFLKLK